MRVTSRPSGFNSRARYIAVASPSMFGFVARMTSVDVLVLDAREQLLDAQLLGPDAFDRRDRALQHVVAPAELARALDGDDVARLFDDADDVRIAPLVAAEGAQLAFGDVEAAPAPRRRGPSRRRSTRRAACASSGRRLQQVERDALRGLRADAGQAARARRSAPGPVLRRAPTDVAPQPSSPPRPPSRAHSRSRPEVAAPSFCCCSSLRLARRLGDRGDARDPRASRRRRDRRHSGRSRSRRSSPSAGDGRLHHAAARRSPRRPRSRASSCAACMSACIFWICCEHVHRVGAFVTLVSGRVSGHSRGRSSTTCAPRSATSGATGSGVGGVGRVDELVEVDFVLFLVGGVASAACGGRAAPRPDRDATRRARRSRAGAARSAAATELRRRTRALIAVGLAAEARVDRLEARRRGTPNTITPSSTPIGCASCDRRAQRRLQRLEHGRPRLDHVVERSRSGIAPASGRRRVGAPAGSRRRPAARSRRRRVGVGLRRAARRGEHRPTARRRGVGRGRRRRRSGAAVGAASARARRRRRRRAPGQLPFEALDPVEQRLLARARLAPREAHDRDFEHEARVGDRLAADVDDRLTRASRCRARRATLPMRCASAASRAASSAGPS